MIGWSSDERIRKSPTEAAGQTNPGGLEPPYSNRRTCRDTGPAVLRLACDHAATPAVITGGSGMGTLFVGCSGPSCQSRPETGSLSCTGCDGGHTECRARQGRKAPQEEDLASIDTVLRLYSTGDDLRNAGVAQSQDACRVTGVICPRGAIPMRRPSSTRSTPDPLGRVRAPRGPHVPEPRHCLALSLAPLG